MKLITAAIRDAVDTIHQGPLYVAFSGGMDSSVLLHGLSQCSLSFEVVALHVNHGLHEAADQWSEHCQTICERMGVSYQEHRVQVAARGNLEASARRARYKVFDQALTSGGVLFLAHHADDQLETLLLRLVQGKGVLPMPATRRLGAGYLVRPLLSVSRRDLEIYAQHHELDYLIDPSNSDQRFDRNYLRSNVTPILRERWPEIEQRIAGIATAYQQDQGLLKALIDQNVVTQGEPSLPGALLGSLSPDLQTSLVRTWLEMNGISAPSRAALKEFISQLESPDDRQPCLVIRDSRLQRYRSDLYLVRQAASLEAIYPLWDQTVCKLPHGELRRRKGDPGIPWDSNLEIRFRSGGEVLEPRLGPRISVKRLFQEAGVPPWQRARYPLIYSREQLVAVPGIADIGARSDTCFQFEWIFD